VTVNGPDELQAIVDETHQMFSDLMFVVEVEPFAERDLVAARWIGTGATKDGPARFTGTDILRFADGRFVEYWTGTSTAEATPATPTTRTAACVLGEGDT
jgi:hypothetical protein